MCPRDVPLDRGLAIRARQPFVPGKALSNGSVALPIGCYVPVVKHTPDRA